jgi:hypothetical protein
MDVFVASDFGLYFMIGFGMSGVLFFMIAGWAAAYKALKAI